MTAYWNRNIHGRKRRGLYADSDEDAVGHQVTLDQLRNMVGSKHHPVRTSKAVSDLSDASTAISRRQTFSRQEVDRPSEQQRVQAPSFQTAADLAGLQIRPSTPQRKKGRRGGVLHVSPAAVLAGGVGVQDVPDNKMTSSEKSELGPFESIIKGEVTADHVRQILSMRLESGMSVTEEDIGGLEDVKKLIRRKIIGPLRRPDLYVGLYQAAKGILFFGPPGTGKTMLGKWIATETGASFLNVTSSSLISKFIGETETLVRTLFLVAESISPCIVFLDEIDSLIGKRRDKEEDATIRMKNQLLQAMDGIASSPGSTVIVIGATNRPDAVDIAALRRLPKRVYIPLPDTQGRIRQLTNILQRHQKELGRDSEISHSDLSKIAEKLQGYNGSDLIALCTVGAEIVYEDTIADYGGALDKLSGPHMFRVPNFADLIRAMTHIRPSGNAKYDIDYAEWADRLGCL